MKKLCEKDKSANGEDFIHCIVIKKILNKFLALKDYRKRVGIIKNID